MGANQKHVTVGIVGGGIAGLTLARMLELLGISYCLWEAHNTFAPQFGASVGLLPNGLRILDQLGIYKYLKPYNVPHQGWEHRDSQGRLQARSHYHGQFEERTGYGIFFMERQRLLQILYDNIEDKSTLSTSKRVVAVQSHEQEAVLVAADGSRVSCDFVAGADGVRSVVRRVIEQKAPHHGVKGVLDRFDARYACVYGISNAVPNLGPGRVYCVYRADVSVLIFTGRSDVYWFIFQDLKRVIPFEVPERFTEQDIDHLCTQVADTLITDGVAFASVIQRKRVAVMTALEEGIADPFSYGRLFVVGDSAHKMVPHAAMGANQALESAAAFVNVLRPVLAQQEQATRSSVPISMVEDCLNQYARRRRERVTLAQQVASQACRAQLKIGPESEKVWAELPTLTDEVLLSRRLDYFRAAEYLENWRYTTQRIARYAAAVRKCRNEFRPNL